MPKVLISLTNFYPKVGGLERYVEELFSRLVEQKGYEVCIVTHDNSDAPRHEVYRGMEIYRIGSAFSVGGVFGMPVLAEWRRFVREVAEPGGFDYVSTQTRFFLSSLMGAMLARKLKIPLIHTEHGGSYVASPSKVVEIGARVYDDTFGRWVLRSASGITGVSNQVRRFVRYLGNRDLEVVHNGVDSSFWDPGKAAPLSRELSDWIGGRKPLLFMGRILEAKGWRVLLDALIALPDAQKQSYALLIAGSGPDEGALAQAMRERSLDGSVRLLGRQTPEQIRSILNDAAYLNPSYSGEGLQTTLLEAAAMSSYIISTDVSGAEEVVVDPSIGMLVGQRDVSGLTEALSRYLKERPQGAGRPLIAEQFSWKSIVATYDAYVNRVLANRQKKTRVLMLRSNPVDPDPRVEKEARVIARFARVTVLAWDRTGALPRVQDTEFGTIRRAGIKASYGGVKILLGLVRFNLWLIDELAFSRYDIVHACDLDTGFATLLIAKLRRKKIVYDMFDMYSEASSELLPAPVLRVAWWLEKQVVEHADATIIVDDQRRIQLAGMTPRKLEVVYNSPEDIQLAKNLPPHAGLEIFYTGVLARNRGFDYLVQSIAGVTGARLTIGGYGGDEDHIKGVIESVPGADFIGRISYAEVLRRSQEADILFALYDPAVKNHKFSSPNKLFEAMLLGKPIIVSDGTGMSEIVRQVGNGIVVEYGNALALTAAVELLRDPRLRHEMGAKGRIAYEKEYGWPIMAERLTGLYRGIGAV